MPTEEQKQKRARIVWRETPVKEMGKPETVREVVLATDEANLREQFWSSPAFSKSKTRKVEILKIEWL